MALKINFIAILIIFIYVSKLQGAQDSLVSHESCLPAMKSPYVSSFLSLGPVNEKLNSCFGQEYVFKLSKWYQDGRIVFGIF